MKFLADVNVIFPLLVSRHQHRTKAVEWFDSVGAGDVVLNLNPAMERKSVTQSRKGAKSWEMVHLHPMGEWMLSCKFPFFAPLRLGVTSHSRF